MPSLYTLSEKYKFLNEYVDSALSNEEIDEDDLQVYKDTLEFIEDEIDTKSENIVKFITNLNGDIAAYKTEEERLAKKRKYLENKQKWLKEYLQGFLELNNIDTVNAGTFKIKLCKTNPSADVLDESKVPDKYKVKQPDKIDKKLLLADLKKLTDGEVIEGAVMISDKKHIKIS
jgi:hypothetical protein